MTTMRESVARAIREYGRKHPHTYLYEDMADAAITACLTVLAAELEQERLRPGCVKSVGLVIAIGIVHSHLPSQPEVPSDR